jgi:hypothetical protein
MTMDTATPHSSARTSHRHSSGPILLTPQEAAEILDSDETELRQWRRDNVGPTFHDLGRGLIRYARASVEQYAQASASERPARS